MKVARIYLMVALTTVAVSLQADWCQYIYHEATESQNAYWTEECHPEYYTEMTSPPDLALYATCDIMWIRTHVENGQVIHDAWYAFQWGDPNGMNQPTGFSSGPYCVVHNADGSHGLSLIP